MKIGSRWIKAISLAAAVLVALAAAGCGNAQDKGKAEAQKPAKIRFAYTTSMTGELIMIARQQGWFEEEFAKDGIAIEYNKFMNGPPVIEAFGGGRLDIGQVGDQPAIQARANGIDIKAIGVYCQGVFTPTAKYTSVLVPPDSDIRTIKDLKGKKVGVPVGTNLHKVFLYFLKYHGLTVNDIKLVNMDYVNIKTAIATKNVDAGVLIEPFVGAIELEGTGRVIDDATDIKPVYNLIIVSNEFAQKYPDIVARVLKVYAKAARWIAENPQKANELVAKDSGVKLEIVEKAVRSNRFDLRITDVTRQSVKETERFLRENNLIKRDVDVDELLEKKFLKAIGL
jgi:sulfonate transport system substrate-binding protein